MKRNVLFFLLTLPFLSQGVALKLQTVSFLDGNMQPFIEVQYQIPSKSIKFGKNATGNWQGAILMRVLVSQNDKILFNESYDLFSQELQDTNILFQLTDFKRISVGNGPIAVMVQATDYLTGKKANEREDFIFQRPSLNSGLCFIDDYYQLDEPVLVSHGKTLLLPQLTPRYRSIKNHGLVYFETYKKGGAFQICVYDSLDNLYYKQLVDHGQEKIKQHVVKLPRLQIGDGNLKVTLEKQSTGEVLAQGKIWVQKADDGERFMQVSKRQIERYIEWVTPIGELSELSMLVDSYNSPDTIEAKRGFYAFWIAKSSKKPWLAWVQYQKLVAHVNKTYQIGKMPGYKTDRGRVFLQYGKPFDIVEIANTPTSYDYEIWQYPNDGKTGDARFYFVNYSFTHNNFTLVHSTSLGEAQNPNWKETLNRSKQDYFQKGGGIGTQSNQEFINE